MPHIGHIGEFDSKLETLDSYLERVDEYFIVNNIGQAAAGANAAAEAVAARQKAAALISILGRETYSVLKDLTKPDKPNTKSFDQLCTFLKEHYQPRTIEVAEAFRFHRCVQSESENVKSYSARLRGNADNCGFGTFLARALRDQFVCGIRSKETQRKLLAENKTFDECIAVAIADEAAARESSAFHATDTTESSVHFVQKKKKASSATFSKKYVCFSCGSSAHRRDECKWRDAICHKCKRKGHLKVVCKDDNHFLQEEVEEEEEVVEMFMFSDSDVRVQNGIFVPLRLEDKECTMQLDTGASKTVVPQSFFDKFCSHIPLQKTNTIMTTYTRESVVPEGKAEVKVTYEGKHYTLPLIVVKQGSCALLGRDWLEKIKLDWSKLPGIHYVSNKDAVTGLTKVLEKFDCLFNSELGCYQGSPTELNVHTPPKFCKARPVPFAIRDRVKVALDKMENEGVIRQVSSSQCAAPFVVVQKKNSEELRICGDFSVTYNPCAELVQYPIPKIEDLHAAMHGCSVFSVLDMRSAYHQIPIAEESQKYLTINTLQGLYMRSLDCLSASILPPQSSRRQWIPYLLNVICYLDVTSS